MASFADVETEFAVLKVKDTKVYKAALEVKLEVRSKLAGVLDGGADEYTLPSREEVEAKRNDARAAAAANAPPPPPPAPRGRSTRTKRDPRAGWGRYG